MMILTLFAESIGSAATKFMVKSISTVKKNGLYPFKIKYKRLIIHSNLFIIISALAVAFEQVLMRNSKRLREYLMDLLIDKLGEQGFLNQRMISHKVTLV